MQAITTRRLGPNNTRPTRTKATAEGGTVTIDWDSHKDDIDNHRAAAYALCEALGWKGELVTGSVTLGYVHVFK